MTLRVYNTATRAKEEFVPLDPEGKQVKVYVCGVTVYDAVHLGHARSYVAHDTIRRYLEWSGYQVKYVQNFTDIDDRIIARANERGIDPAKLAEEQIADYFTDMARLNIKEATVYPKATTHIPQMLALVESLIEKGFAYVAEPAPEALEGSRDVFFEVAKAGEAFGSLTNQSLEDMQAGARVEVDPRKRHPADFALWKGAKPDEPTWESPWGPGRPGWHLECSAMSLEHLGTQFDIHGGGRDLIFPHHEAEILQSECHTGVHPLVKYWMHNGFVNVDKEKMSKSLGNFFTLRDILEHYDPMVVRFFLLNTHYRSPIDFSDAHLEEAKAAYERLFNSYWKLSEIIENMMERGDPRITNEAIKQNEKVKKKFIKSMDDDFNTREGIAALFEFGRFINRNLLSVDKRIMEESLSIFEDFGSNVLGLFKDEISIDTIQELSKYFKNEIPYIYQEKFQDYHMEFTQRILSINFEIEPFDSIVDPNISPDFQQIKISEPITSPINFREIINILLEFRTICRNKRDWATADAIRDKLNELGIVVEDEGQGAKWRLE